MLIVIWLMTVSIGCATNIFGENYYNSIQQLNLKFKSNFSVPNQLLLKPPGETIINESIVFNLTDSNKVTITDPDQPQIESRIDLFMTNVFGFLIGFHSFLIVDSDQIRPLITIYFSQSRLQVLDKSRNVLGSCREQINYSHAQTRNVNLNLSNEIELNEFVANQFKGLFTNVDILNFYKNVVYERKICPLLFKNNSISTLVICCLTDLRIRRNLIEFDDLDEISARLEANIDVSSVSFVDIHNLRLSNKILNRQLFENVRDVNLRGVLLSIDDWTFKAFAQLKAITISIFNLDYFIHSSFNKWFQSVNYGKSLDEALNQSASIVDYLQANAVTLVMSDELLRENRVEDICVFKYFPQDQIVLMEYGLKRLNQMENASCALLYVYRVQILYLTTDLEALLGACNFTHLLSLCDTRKLSYRVGWLFTDHDLSNMLNWIEFIGPIITFPIISFTGLVLNLAIILILTNKTNRREHFKGEKLFKFILLTATFNFVECLVSILKLINICLGSNALYCSSVVNTEWSQYLRVYLIEYLGEAMKTCSTLSNLAFSLERLLSTLKVDLVVFKKFQSMSTKVFLAFILIFSLIISLNKIDEFEYDFEGFFNEKPNVQLTKVNFSTILKSFSSILYFLHYLITDIVVVAVTIFIDFVLIVHVRRELNQKIKKTMTLENNKALLANKLDELIEKKREIKRLVIFSLALNLCTRVPEAIYSYTYSAQRAFFESLPNTASQLDQALEISNIFYDLIQYLYQLSYIFNIFFYYSFNRTFREATQSFLKKSK